MNDELDRLFTQIRGLEDQIERRLDAHRDQFNYRLARGRAVFDAEVRVAHHRVRKGIYRYLYETPIRHLAMAPFIYAVVIPIAFLDLSMTIYQSICFTFMGIARVPRRRYVVIDRHRLPYLNAIEKLNCMYCGYANGVLAYAVEIGSRTEQYWCPIRHATQIAGPHTRYKDFATYGDAESYRTRLEDLRAKLR